MNPFHELTDDLPISNLPDWPGADASYHRAYVWMAKLAAKTYRECKPAPYVWNGRLYGYSQPEDITTMIEALNKGEEEVIKGLNHKYIKYWIK